MKWFAKSRRARSVSDFETWKEGGAIPTLNVFDNATETRATVVVVHGSIVRRLTPVECERLQGFPDNWTDGQADSHRYKQMGNAVTVNVAEVVGRFIMEAAADNA